MLKGKNMLVHKYRFHLMFAALMIELIAGSVSITAQSFPNRAVKIVVPAAPGGSLDISARLLARKVSETWNEPVIVENRPGWNWDPGHDSSCASFPLMVTSLLLAATAAVTINPLVFPDMPIDPLRDLTPVIRPTETPFVLLVNRNLPVENANDFINYLRANPGKLNHGSNSASTILISELFKRGKG